MTAIDRQQVRADTTFGFIDSSVPSDQLYHPLLISNEAENTMLRAIRHELARSDRFTLSVAFITTSAIALLKQALLDYKGHGTIVTSTYLGFNSPDAFRELLTFENVQVFVHPEEGPGFHAKGYVFEQAETTTAIIGSSNLTSNALLRNKEWNLRFSALPGGDITAQICTDIDRQIEVSKPLTPSWITSYEIQYRSAPPVAHVLDAQYPLDRFVHRPGPIAPNLMQVEALEEIAAVREAGETRAVVVSATGTGKTILAALDVRAAQPKRMLFIVHREQILDKAMEAFEAVLGVDTAELGKLVGTRQDLNHRFVFATIQSLSRPQTLEKIDTKHFDYVLIDEVHRAGAESYRRVIEWLEPNFLLGLTATPERTDDFNVFELFDYNVPYEIRLQKALEADMLAPFHYFGVTDYIDATGSTVDDTADLARLVVHERVDHIVLAIHKYGHTGTTKGLIFCSRNDESEELSELLNRREVNGKNLRTRSLSGKDTIEMREDVVAQLERGELDYILTVDIFNEGIDIPSVNQIVLLRQTQSSIVFTQQLGRGLRKAAGKDHLRVIDFIGNYANNFLIPIALLGNSSLNKDSIRQGLIQADQAGAIAGLSSINFDRISRDRVLSSIEFTNLDSMQNLKRAFNELKQRVGGPPALQDFARFDTADPVVIATKAGNYWNFLNKVKAEDARPTEAQSALLTFLSHELLNGKRPQELLILEHLIEQGAIDADGIKSLLEKHDCINSDETIQSALRVLSLTFHTASERKKYGETPLISTDSANITSLSGATKALLDGSQKLRKHFVDAIDTGLFLARHRTNWSGGLQPGQMYSRKDVCRLLNWKANEYSTIYGYKVDYISSTCPIFVTYHKGDEVAASTRYGDELLDRSTLRWFTRSNRTLESAEVQAIVDNKVPLHLFTKKDDTEGTGFYYLGKARSSEAIQEQMPGDKGRLLNVVTMNLELEQPIGEGLYDYLTSKSSLSD